MHIHILGICGTFMGSLAILAKQQGHRVTGSDSGVYPPMSTQLEAQGIELIEGYGAEQLEPRPDLVVVGNALSRGVPVVEALLDKGLPYTSGPQFLAEHLLKERWVLAVAGTHGKTTTASMLAWILECAGMAPGFLIGGVPKDFGISARSGGTPFFVIEADEYDTAFFDKRSKFVHYHPRTLLLNNLEFDHADIFEDLAAIERQFHHLIRTVPGSGLIVAPAADLALQETLAKGCWTPVAKFGSRHTDAPWQLEPLSADGSYFAVWLEGERQGEVRWHHTGVHNMYNALGAIAMARHVGVRPVDACAALAEFQGVKRRMDLVGEFGGIQVYDDFAHHPSAIATTLEGVRAQMQGTRGELWAVIEPRSNSMRMGAHRDGLAESVLGASRVLWYQSPGLKWDLVELARSCPVPAMVEDTVDRIIDRLVRDARPGDRIVLMSNGGFGGIHKRLARALKEKYGAAGAGE